MSRLLYRLGRGSAAHPWRVLAAWLVVAGVVFGLAGAYGGEPQDDWNVPDARAQRGIEMLRDHVPGAGNANARVVVHTNDGTVDRADVKVLADRLAAMEHAVTVSAPSYSVDGDTAVVVVGYDVPVTDPDLFGNVDSLEEAVEPTRDAGYTVEMNGMVPETAAAPMSGRGELIGVVVALAILVLAFGSVVSAGLPIGVALVGLAVGSGGLALLAGAMDVSTTAPTVATMVGLGVGIDYALLLVSRHAEYLRNGLSVPDAAGRAVATAGRSVVFAAGTVLVSLMGLRLAGLQTYASFGFATAITVVLVAAAALTLVPAFARFAGHRVLPRRVRRDRERSSQPFTARWAARVGRRPLPWAVAAAAVLVLLALPAADMRTWPGDAGNQSTDLTTRRAHDVLTAEFGPGLNTNYVVVADRTAIDDQELRDLRVELLDTEGVVSLTDPMTSPDGVLSVFELQPAFGGQDERTPDLVDAVREVLPAGAELTGDTPLFADISALLGERLWLVIAFVVVVSMLLLAMVFRSVLIPVKAALMNLLSIGASYGVLVAVFQWGWGVELLGMDAATPVSSWIPILIFAILFGLSMDYEVFLLSRVRERWLDSGDAHGSVIAGLADTGRVISSAAAIMVAVFLGFATEVDVVVKMLGLGMATAIFLDATLVRMVLVPATMSLLGRWNWWIPAWLDRLLPHVEVEASPEELTTDLDDPTPAGV